MKRSGFQQKARKPMKRTALKARTHLRRATSLATGSKPKKAIKTRKKKSPLSKLKKQLWQLCREITIKRDGSDCYTCPSKALEGSNRQLGHFISSSICSTELRYDLDNLRIQCYSCNINKSGNWLAYENRLKREYGEEYVQELKERNENTKGLMYRESWYEEKITHYQTILESI
jgi:5-methylcytosine-specific restriction endonuclease McrA